MGIGEMKDKKVDSDPTGKEIHDPGAKMDEGKLKVGLVLGCFPRALKEVSAIGTYGSNKYSPKGWLKVPDAERRYKDALYRHLLEAEITTKDVESHLDHLSHAAWNMLAWCELRQRRLEKENEQRMKGRVSPTFHLNKKPSFSF